MHAIIIDAIIHPTFLPLLTGALTYPVHADGGLFKNEHMAINNYVEFSVPA